MSTRRMPHLFQNNVHITFCTDKVCFNFVAGRSSMMPMHWLLLGFLGNVCKTMFHYLWCSSPKTRHRQGTTAEISMMTQVLCFLLSVVLAPTLHTIFWTSALCNKEQEMTAEVCICEAIILHNAFSHKLHNDGLPPTVVLMIAPTPASLYLSDRAEQHRNVGSCKDKLSRGFR